MWYMILLILGGLLYPALEAIDHWGMLVAEKKGEPFAVEEKL